MENDRQSKAERFVAVVASNDQTRNAIANALESMGSAKVVQFKSPQQLLAFHKLAKIEWIFTESFRDQSLTALEMVRKLRFGDVNRTINVSLFINRPVDNDLIPEAFHLGVMSFHAAKYSPMEILSELGELQKLVIYHKRLMPLVAAHYLRVFFNETGDYQGRIDMETRLVAIFKFHPDVLVNLAEVEFALGKKEEAVNHLGQAAAVAPVYSAKVQQLREKFLSPQENQALAQQASERPLFPIKTVLLVDNDLAVAQIVKLAMNKVGIKDVKHFQTAEDALAELKPGQPVDLLLTEWRLAGEISGSGLVQRVRKMGLGDLRIAVVSSLLKKSDEHLLDEVGVDCVIGKPLTQGAVIEMLIELSSMDNRPKHHRSLQRKINALLASHHVAEAEDHVSEYMGLDEPDEFQKLEVLAGWLLANGNYAEAVEKAARVMEEGRVTPAIMMIMGRALLKLKDYTNSILFFERAQIASPDGIDRLLELAEAKVSVNDLEGAAAEISKAIAIDPENEWVILAECSIALERGEVKKASGRLAKMSSGKDMASLMNNRAVALAQMGKIADAISLYNKTIEAMPPSWKSEIARVTYNLGLSHVRCGSYAKAVEVFETIGKGNKSIRDKAMDISDKCARALAQGRKLSFHPVEDAVLKQSKNVVKKVDVSKLLNKSELKPGDAGLMGIFQMQGAARGATPDRVDKLKLSVAKAS